MAKEGKYIGNQEDQNSQSREDTATPIQVPSLKADFCPGSLLQSRSRANSAGVGWLLSESRITLRPAKQKGNSSSPISDCTRYSIRPQQRKSKFARLECSAIFPNAAVHDLNREPESGQGGDLAVYSDIDIDLDLGNGGMEDSPSNAINPVREVGTSFSQLVHTLRNNPKAGLTFTSPISLPQLCPLVTGSSVPQFPGAQRS